MPTYPGRWAGVSGAVSPGEPVEAAAWREVAEETGLAAGALTLAAAGLPVDVDDSRARRPLRFRVHPFRFEVRPGLEPRLDQEHVEARWVEPDEVIALASVGETVPELDEALARVWDPPGALPPPWRAEARAIAEDRAHGAAELARRAVALVLAGAPAERVAALRPTMASVVNAARAAARPGRDVVAELAAAHEAARAAAIGELERARRVATFSRSSTILAALARAAPVELLVGRSEPGGEGEATAAEAARLGHRVELVDDEALRRRVGQVELVLVGADAVTEAGDVVNKLGTRPLAEAAAVAGVPFVVVADAWKRWPDVVPPPLEPIFDVTPAARLSRVVGMSEREGRA